MVTQLGYLFKTFLNSQLLFTHIYGSGDGNPNDGKHQTFDGIFSGADTDMYSWMNFSKTISFRSEYHAFFLDRRSDAWYFPGKAMRHDPQGLSGNFAGQEADFIFRAKLFPWVQFLGGYCIFMPGEFAKNTRSCPIARWAFAELTFTF
ncbi:hypothetical protein ES708_12856 [subsurface metagenome]